MFCKNCGAEILDGAKFCAACGTRVEEEVVAEQETPVAEEVTETVTTEETAKEEPTVETQPTQENKGPDPFFSGATQNTQTNQTYQAQPNVAKKGGFFGDMSNLNGMQIFGLIMSAIFALHTLTHALGAIGNVFRTITSAFRYYTPGGYTVTSLFGCVFQLVAAALAFALCVVFFGVFRCWKPEKSTKYFTIIATASGAFVLLSIVSGVFSTIYYFIHDFLYSYSSLSWLRSGVGVPFLLVIAAIAGYIALANNAGADPFAGGYNFGEEIKTIVDDFKGIISDIQDAIAGDGVSTATTYGQNTMTGTFTAGAAATAAAAGATAAEGGNIYTTRTPVTPSGDPVNTGFNGGNNGMRYGALKTDRSIWAYIFLSMITCGIYGLYLFYTVVRDVNIACDGDGEHTTDFILYIVLTIITCGIYHFFYIYKLGNRLQKNAPRYGLSFQENGTSVLMWNLFGMFLCGIGVYVAMNIILENTNAICREYNAYNNL